jgi:hypothetical protein
MTYIQKSATNATVTPFDVGKMSGSTAIGARQVFDTFNASWLSFDSSTGVISADDAFFTEACFSPNSNAYGNSKVGETTSTPKHMVGQVLPESSSTGAGGHGRGDDIAYYYAANQYPKWLVVISTTTAPDTDLTHLKIMRL